MGMTARAFWPESGCAHWRPIDGIPTSLCEKIVHALLRVLASRTGYIAVIVTLILLIQLFGLPWGNGR